MESEGFLRLVRIFLPNSVQEVRARPYDPGLLTLVTSTNTDESMKKVKFSIEFDRQQNDFTFEGKSWALFVAPLSNFGANIPDKLHLKIKHRTDKQEVSEICEAEVLNSQERQLGEILVTTIRPEYQVDKKDKRLFLFKLQVLPELTLGQIPAEKTVGAAIAWLSHRFAKLEPQKTNSPNLECVLE